MIVVNGCHTCLNEAESLDHLLFALSLWTSTLDWFDYNWILPSCGVSVSGLEFGGGFGQGRIMWKASFLTVLWLIWKERSTRRFEGGVFYGRHYPAQH